MYLILKIIITPEENREICAFEVFGFLLSWFHFVLSSCLAPCGSLSHGATYNTVRQQTSLSPSSYRSATTLHRIVL